MGNKNSGGFLKLDKTVYSPGDNIFGEFCVKLSQDIYGEYIMLRFRGIESVEWEELTDQGMRLLRGNNTIISHDLMLYRIPFNALAKGEYAFQFVVELPKDIPTSTSFSLPRLKGQIEYTIEALIVGADVSSVASIKVVDVSKIQPSLSEVCTDLKGVLWIERGQIYIRAKCDSGYSFEDEKLKVGIDVDRSRSSWAVGAIDVSIIQTISVKSNEGHRYLRKTPLYRRHIPLQRDAFALEIAVSSLAKSSNITASSIGKYLEVGYSIEINGIMESIFACYGPQPQIVLWFSIIPKDKEREVPVYSAQWKPKVIEVERRSSVPIYS